MTLYASHLGLGQGSTSWRHGLGHPVTSDPRSVAPRPRISGRALLIVVLETAILITTLQVMMGLGSATQAGHGPTPAGAYGAAPDVALVAPARDEAGGLHAATPGIELPAPLLPPALPPEPSR